MLSFKVKAWCLVSQLKSLEGQVHLMWVAHCFCKFEQYNYFKCFYSNFHKAKKEKRYLDYQVSKCDDHVKERTLKIIFTSIYKL